MAEWIDVTETLIIGQAGTPRMVTSHLVFVADIQYRDGYRANGVLVPNVDTKRDVAQRLKQLYGGFRGRIHAIENIRTVEADVLTSAATESIPTNSSQP